MSKHSKRQKTPSIAMVRRASQNIIDIIEREVTESLESGQIPPGTTIEGFRVSMNRIEVDLSNNTTMEIELGLPH